MSWAGSLTSCAKFLVCHGSAEMVVGWWSESCLNRGLINCYKNLTKRIIRKSWLNLIPFCRVGRQQDQPRWRMRRMTIGVHWMPWCPRYQDLMEQVLWLSKGWKSELERQLSSISICVTQLVPSWISLWSQLRHFEDYGMKWLLWYRPPVSPMKHRCVECNWTELPKCPMMSVPHLLSLEDRIRGNKKEKILVFLCKIQ